MRREAEVDLRLIDIDRLPLDEKTILYANALAAGANFPPIRLHPRNERGRWKIKDGRHRWLAHRMLKRWKIKAKFWEGEKRMTTNDWFTPTASEELEDFDSRIRLPEPGDLKSYERIAKRDRDDD